MSYNFESVEQAEAALDGRWGEDVADAAEELLDGMGWYDDEEPAEEEFDHDDAWGKEFTAQAQRLEQQLGHPLSMKELDTLIADQGASDQVPDLKESYDRAIGRDFSNKDDRQAIGAEIYAEHKAAQEAVEPPPEPEGWDPRGED